MMKLIQSTLDGKPVEPNEIRPYRWITLAEQKKFNDFLSEIGFDDNATVSSGKLLWCASEFEKYKCANNADHSRVTRYISCGFRGLCPRCSMSYAHKRAGIMYQWLKDNLAKQVYEFDLKMNQLVLTLPKDLHDMDRKLFIRMIKAFLKQYGIDAYGYCVQDRHSKDPLAGKYLHVHILFLNVAEGEKGLEKREYYFDLDKMRSDWKAVIEHMTGVSVEGEVNLHNEYASVLYNPEKIKHWLAYLYRYPVQDLFLAQVRDESINYVQTEQIENFSSGDDTVNSNILQLKLSEKVSEMTQEPKPRIVWCGLLASGSRARLIKLLGMGADSWKNLRDVEKELDLRAKTCRDCGCQLEKEPYEVGEYDGKNEPVFMTNFR